MKVPPPEVSRRLPFQWTKPKKKFGFVPYGTRVNPAETHGEPVMRPSVGSGVLDSSAQTTLAGAVESGPPAEGPTYAHASAQDSAAHTEA